MVYATSLVPGSPKLRPLSERLIESSAVAPAHSAAPVFKVVVHPAFELIESIVRDGVTGKRLDGLADVTRGSVREETLRFVVFAPLGKLRRKTTTAMRIMGMWQNVANETLEMGEFDTPGTHEFQMPTANIPNSAFAAGRFKTEVLYTCDRLEGEVLRREWDIEFSIV